MVDGYAFATDLNLISEEPHASKAVTCRLIDTEGSEEGFRCQGFRRILTLLKRVGRKAKPHHEACMCKQWWEQQEAASCR